MQSREQYIQQLRDYLNNERVVGLAATRWHNPRSGTTPLYELFDEIQPTIDYLETHGGTGSRGQKLISQIKSALVVADKGLQHGESSGSVAALRQFVDLRIAAYESETLGDIERLETEVQHVLSHLGLESGWVKEAKA